MFYEIPTNIGTSWMMLSSIWSPYTNIISVKLRVGFEDDASNPIKKPLKEPSSEEPLKGSLRLIESDSIQPCDSIAFYCYSSHSQSRFGSYKKASSVVPWLLNINSI